MGQEETNKTKQEQKKKKGFCCFVQVLFWIRMLIWGMRETVREKQVTCGGPRTNVNSEGMKEEGGARGFGKKKGEEEEEEEEKEREKGEKHSP